MARWTTVVPLNLTVIPEPAQAKFSDTLDIDQDGQLLYLGDNWSGGVDVFDISTPQPVFRKTIKLRGRIYGVVLAKNVGKVFVGMTGSTVAAIDTGSDNKVLAQIHTGGSGHVDLIDYDPEHKRIFAANRLDGFMACIDAVTNEMVGRVEGLGGGLEQPRFNPADGMVYLTDNRENVLYQIDPVANRLVKTFKIADDCFPNGMAINPETNQAVLACSNKDRPHTLIWDLTRQEIDSVIEESGCADGVMYEPTLDRFLVAAAGFTGGPVVGIFGGSPVSFLTNVPTVPGASWVAYDRKHKLVYVPAAKDGKPALVSFTLPDA